MTKSQLFTNKQRILAGDGYPKQIFPEGILSTLFFKCPPTDF
jgi:hypothetical protein